MENVIAEESTATLYLFFLRENLKVRIKWEAGWLESFMFIFYDMSCSVKKKLSDFNVKNCYNIIVKELIIILYLFSHVSLLKNKK